MRSMRALLSVITAIALTAVAGCGDDAAPAGDASAPAPQATTRAPRDATSPTSPTGSTAPSPSTARLRRGSLRVVAKDLEVPWDIAFLPGGDALVSERDAAQIIRIPAGGGAPRVELRVPGVVPGGEGGLLGLAVSPTFSRDHEIYAYLTAERDNRIVRIDLESKAVTPILTGLRKAQIHNGGSLAFGPDRRLYAGVGETGDTALAQDPKSLNGKILRITTSGRPAPGNPFSGSRIWSLGHRNVQGLAWDRSGRLWASEFGQNTTDEVNLIRAGRNYGWPIVEGQGSTQGGRFANPVVTWSPTSTSSPSGAAIAGNELYVSALAGRKLWRIPLTGSTAGRPTALFGERYGRIRAVATAPDGSIWFSTSNRDGRGEPQNGDDQILQLGT